MIIYTTYDRNKNIFLRPYVTVQKFANPEKVNKLPLIYIQIYIYIFQR